MIKPIEDSGDVSRVACIGTNGRPQRPPFDLELPVCPPFELPQGRR